MCTNNEAYTAVSAAGSVAGLAEPLPEGLPPSHDHLKDPEESYSSVNSPLKGDDTLDHEVSLLVLHHNMRVLA